jgi:AbrB family looped-hinge helix DNA binding protein
MLDEMKFYGSATVGTKGQIVIPYEAREELGIKPTNKLMIIRLPHGEGFAVLKTGMLEKVLVDMQSHVSSMTKSIKSAKEEK